MTTALGTVGWISCWILHVGCNTTVPCRIVDATIHRGRRVVIHLEENTGIGIRLDTQIAIVVFMPVHRESVEDTVFSHVDIANVIIELVARSTSRRPV